MVKNNKPEEEPRSPKEIGPSKSMVKTTFLGIKNDVTEEDLEKPEVAKVIARTLLGDIKVHQGEILELRDFKDRYYEKNKDCAVLEERLSGLEESVGIRSLFFTLGGLFLGLVFVPEMSRYQIGLGILGLSCLFLAMRNSSISGKK